MKTLFSIAKPFRRSVLLAVAAFALVGFIGAGNVSAQRIVKAINTTGQAGQQFILTLTLDSLGNEVAGGFSVNFDQTKLSISSTSGSSNPDVSFGTGVPAGYSLIVNANSASQGRIGMLFDGGTAFTAGVGRELFRLRFTVLPGAASGPTTISFGNSPVSQNWSDAKAQTIPATYEPGTVTIQASAPPVTVSGRVTVPGGAGLRGAIVTMTDSNNVRRVATTSSFGYFIFTNVPSGGSYTVAVQSRRYTFTPRTQTISTNLTDFDFAAQ